MNLKQLEENRIIKPYYRWLKTRIKSFYLNHQIPSNRVTAKEYQSVKERYDRLIEDIVSEINSYRENELTPFQKPSDPEMIHGFQPLSVVGDDMGRVIQYEGKIYRGIYKESMPGFEIVWNTGILPVLARHHIIPDVYLTNYVTDEFGLILGVEEVSIQEYTVWNYAMNRDACITVLLLKTIANRFGLTLKDGHLNNITFDHGSSMFVDIGSIIPETNNGILTELVFAGIYRLVFGFIGNSMMYRLPTHDDNNENVFVKPRSYNLMAREYQNALKVLKRHYLFHGGFRQLGMIHRIFDLNEFEAQDIELLFPVKEAGDDELYIKEWDSIAEKLIPLECSGYVTTGGTCGLLEEQILKRKPDAKVRCLDYEEGRHNTCYLRLKDRGFPVEFYLYNYVYLQEHHASDICGDTVVLIDPLDDNAAFWPVKESVRAHAAERLSKRYIALIYPFEKEYRYTAFFEKELSDSCELIREISLENNQVQMMICQKKG